MRSVSLGSALDEQHAAAALHRPHRARGSPADREPGARRRSRLRSRIRWWRHPSCSNGRSCGARRIRPTVAWELRAVACPRSSSPRARRPPCSGRPWCPHDPSHAPPADPQTEGLPTAADAPLEWLVANGLGGYASGSVDGPPMRRFHGFLIAALPAPLGRALLLHALHEVVELDGAPAQSLQPGRDGDPPVVPAVSFCLQAGLPQWTLHPRRRCPPGAHGLRAARPEHRPCPLPVDRRHDTGARCASGPGSTSGRTRGW